MRAAPAVRQPPIAALAAAADLLGELPSRVEDALPPRPRTVFRLLRVGALDAAWLVLVDNATGLVEEPFKASTSSGAIRTAWRLPLITRIEPPKIFADLPGFRDPRFNPPDDCYDITTSVRLRHQLDEICIANGVATLGGWARLRSLATRPQEQVRLIAANGDAEVSVRGRRRRRPRFGDRQGWESRAARLGWLVSSVGSCKPAAGRRQLDAVARGRPLRCLSSRVPQFAAGGVGASCHVFGHAGRRPVGAVDGQRSTPGTTRGDRSRRIAAATAG